MPARSVQMLRQLSGVLLSVAMGGASRARFSFWFLKLDQRICSASKVSVALGSLKATPRLRMSGKVIGEEMSLLNADPPTSGCRGGARLRRCRSPFILTRILLR
jgi:hypothetical protein